MTTLLGSSISLWEYRHTQNEKLKAFIKLNSDDTDESEGVASESTTDIISSEVFVSISLYHLHA